MRTRRLLVSLLMLLGLWGCAFQAGQGAKRSLLGVSNQQLLIDAQHVLATEGLDVESVDMSTGEITSTWQTKNRKQIQYMVKVKAQSLRPGAPTASATGGAEMGTSAASPGSEARALSTVSLTVLVNVRKK